jgi:beta-mannosidase
MSRRTLDLCGSDWQLGQALPGADPNRAEWSELDRVSKWLPAVVPGNVRADLIRAGRLAEPALSQAPLVGRWVDDSCWWLVCRFHLVSSPGDHVHLVLRGVDYISDLFLNGHYLGRHEGMFSPQVVDVSDLLSGDNLLAIRLLGSRWLPRDRSSPGLKILNRIEARFSGPPDQFPDRRDTLKCQMGFGWDFSPALRTMGLWDDVYLVIGREVVVQDVVIRPRLEPGVARVDVEVELDARQTRAVRLRCVLAGETFECEPLTVEQAMVLARGISRQRLSLTVPQPRLWWPWDHGPPDLYQLTVEALADGQCLDTVSMAVGLRQVELRGWTLHVNGRPVYARGANWVPADLLPGRVTAATYRELLDLARQANMNLLRVWGGGLREKHAFYDLCDRLGIMVWQEFPFACAFLTRYPRSPSYLRLAEAEVRAIVRELRNHPSVAVWCGGNEFSPERNVPLMAVLRSSVVAEDASRPFLLASPYAGESHNWRVWHRFYAPSAYRDDRAFFASEFGLQAPPDVATLRRLLPPDGLWPPGPAWAGRRAGLAKLWRYARPFLPEGEVTLEQFVAASQRAQAHGLQIAIEHYRRRKAEGCGGALVWQLNEPWPAISWSLVDYYRQPKLAYHAVKRLLAPLLVSVDYSEKPYRDGDLLSGTVWLINDRPEALAACDLEVVLHDGTGRPVQRFARSLVLAGNSAEVVGRFDWSLPEGGGGWALACQLSQDGRLLAENEYDLTVCDTLGPTVGQRLWAWLSHLLLRL